MHCLAPASSLFHLQLADKIQTLATSRMALLTEVKVVVLTGVSSGIGRATLLSLLRRGCKVFGRYSTHLNHVYIVEAHTINKRILKYSDIDFTAALMLIRLRT